MSLFIVDVESDGPIPYTYSMISFGVVRVDEKLETTFYGETAPISKLWIPEALAISAISREQHEAYPDPAVTMAKFKEWFEANNQGKYAVFISDNPAFDFGFFNWYAHTYLGNNPFGFSARRIGDFFAGLNNDFYSANKWKGLRKTKHTHNPVDDAKGNAEALIEMCKQHNIKLNY
jgi:hypothetical protein